MNTYRCGLLLAMLALQACTGSSGVEPAPTGVGFNGTTTIELSMTATVELSGLGACSGVPVKLTGPGDERTVLTSDGGALSVSSVAPGAYQVSIDVEGYEHFEDVAVVQGSTDGAAIDLGNWTLEPETVQITGSVALSDGESPAGTVVEIEGEQSASVPQGLTCRDTSISALGRAITETTTVRSDGRYEARVPRRARNVRGRVERPNYTRERIAVDDSAIASASGDTPVDAGTTVLYPLTGFVNVVGGALQNTGLISLQISAFNGAGEMALGRVTDPAGPVCSFGPWQTFSATAVTDLSSLPDGEQTICVRVRNAEEQQVDMYADLVLDRTPPGPPTVLIGSGAAYIGNPTQNVQILTVENGSGAAYVELYDNGGPAQRKLYSTVVSLNLATEGLHTVTAVVEDGAGNRSVPGTASVTLDSVPPTFAAAITNSGRTVSIALSSIVDAGSREYRVGYDGPGATDLALSDAGWQSLPYASDVTVTLLLPAIDGNYTIFVQMRDAAGNIQPTIAQQTVVVDENPPSGLDFDIASSFVSTPTLGLTLTASDNNNVRAEISEQLGFTSYQTITMPASPYVTNYTLQDTSEGYRIIYVRYCDTANNCSSLLSDAVTLDLSGPSSPALGVREGPYTTLPSVTLELFANGADQVLVNGCTNLSGWQTYGVEKVCDLPGAEGLRTISATYRDLAGHTTGPVSATVTWDGTPPAGLSVVIDGGATLTRDRNFALTIDPSDSSEIQIAQNASFAGAAWEPATTYAEVYVGSSDGTKTIYLRGRDEAGNISATDTDEIVLDTTAPELVSVQLDGGAAATNSTTMQVDIVATGAPAEMELLDESGVLLSRRAFAGSTSVTLSPGEGSRSLTVRLWDAAGNGPVAGFDTILVDSIAPTGTIQINGGAAWATTNVVTLNLTASDNLGVAGIRLADTQADLTAATLLPYAPTRSWTLPSGDGLHSVWLQVVDQAGNASAAASAVIELDTTGPLVGSPALQINGGATLTRDPVVAVTLNVLGADEYQLSEDSGFAGAVWTPIAGSASVLLSGADGLKTLYVRYRDAAGNTSAGSSTTITLDRQAPEGVALSGPSVTSSSVVVLTLSANDPNGVEVQLSENADFSGATWYPLTATRAVGLSAGDGIRRIHGRYRDGAGNVGQVLTHDVQVDTSAPANPALTILETPYATSANLTLQISGSGASEMRLSESAGFAGASWQPFSAGAVFTVTNVAGPHRIYLQLRDLAGNISSVTSDTTILDLTDPGTPGVTINGGAAATNERTVSLALTFPDGDETEMQISEDSGFGGANWVSVTSSVQYTLTSGDGTKTVFVRSRDASGRTSPAGQDAIALDTAGPGTPTITINGGASTTNSPVVALALGNQADAVQMRLGNDAAFSGASWQTAAPNTAYTLSSGDGIKTVYVQYRDAVSNESVVSSASIVLDTGRPGSPQILIDADAAYTNDAVVQLTLFSSDASEMRLSENADFAGASWQAYSTSYAYTITTGEGTKTIYAEFRDASLNTTGPVNDSIVYDGTPPATGAGIDIDGGAVYTTDLNVTVTLDIPADAAEMILADNVGFAGSSWQTTSTTISWMLSSGDGTKTIYAKWRDAAGNETPVQSDSIVLDTLAPTPGNPALLIEGGASYSNRSGSLTLTLNASDAYWMEIATDESFASPLISAGYAAVTTVAAPVTDGTYTLYVRFRDNAGNWSGTRSASIVLDRTAPTLSDLVVNDDSGYTNQPDVDVQLFGYDDNPLVEVQTSEDGFATVDSRGFVPAYAYTLSAAEGATTVVQVRIRDAAGNWSLPLTSQAIRFDQTAPNPGVPALTIDGGADWATDPGVTLTIDPGDADEMRISNNGGFAGASWEPVTTELAWNLSGGDGFKEVWIQFRDLAGNETPAMADSITLDTQAPTDGRVFLGLNGAYTNSRTILVDLQATGAYGYAISTDIGFSGPVTGPLAGGVTTTTIVLPPEDGPYIVYGQFYDAAGNQSALAQDFITLDRTAPELYYVQINSDEYFANDPDLQLQLAAWDDNPIAYAIIDTTPTFNSMASAVEPYAASLNYLLPFQGRESTIYVQLVDIAGNASTVTSQVVFLDVTAPTGTVVLDGPRLTNSRSVQMYVWPISSDVVEYQVNTAGVPSSTGWQVYDGTIDYTLPAGDGVHTLYVWLRDWAKNESVAYPVTVTLDTIAPTGDFALAEQPTTSVTTLTVVMVSSGADYAWIAEDVGFSTGVSFAVTSTTEYTLDDPSDGDKIIYVKYCDLAGNCSPTLQQSISIDTEAPQVFTLDIDGGVGRTADPAGNVTLNLFAVDTTSGSGVVGVRLSNTASAVTSAPPQPYEQAKAWTLSPPVGPGVDEVKTVWAIYDDAAGNLAGPVSAQIHYDTVAPSGGLYFDDSITSDTLAGLNIYSGDADAVEMKLSYGATCAGGSWMALTDQTVWALSNLDGQQFVSLQLRDDLGNTSGCLGPASITLDTGGPLPVAFAVTGNTGADPGYTNQVTLTIWAVAGGDISNCSYAEIAEDISFLNPVSSTADCTSFPYVYELAAATDGVHDLYLRFYDDLDNPGPVTQVSITLDRSSPQVPSGGFTIAQGDNVNDPSITLQLDAVGADQAQVQQAGTCGGAWETYASSKSWTLSGGDGTHTLAVRFRTLAGSLSSCYTRLVTLDTSAPAFSASATGTEGVSGRTAQTLIWLTLSGVSGDATDMRISNFAGFPDAAWQPVQTKVPHLLPSGDGTKSVYVQIRDAAGNESAVDVPTIILDQTPPDPPALQLVDQDGDGYAVTEEAVELLWTAPTGTDFFELQRFVLGVDADFAVLDGSLAAAVTSYVDSVTYPGFVYQYRIRGRDQLGNTSGWSLVAVARPYSPITRVNWMLDDDAYRVAFVPETGVFQLDSEYAWSFSDGTGDSLVLGTNVVEWYRPVVSDTRLNEQVTIRERNADNSLLHDTTAILPFNLHQEFGAVNQVSGAPGAIVMLDALTPALFYEQNTLPLGAHMVTFSNGQPVDEALPTGNISDLGGTVDFEGRPVVVYRLSTGGLYLMSKVILSDSFEHSVTNANWVATAGSLSIVTSGRDEPYGTAALRLAGGAYVQSFDLSAYGTLTFRYEFEVGSTINGSEPPDPGDLLHFQYTDDGVSWIDLVVQAPTDGSDAWFTPVTGTVPASAIAVRLYNASGFASGDHYLVDGFALTSDNWTVQAVDVSNSGVGTEPAIAINGNGAPFIVHRDEVADQIMLAHRVNGIWTEIVLDSTAVNGKHSDIDIDSSGTVHIVYNDDETADKIRYASLTADGLLSTDLVYTDPGSRYPGLRGVGIAVDSADVVHIGFTQHTLNQGIYWMSGGLGSWAGPVQVSSLEPEATQHQFAMDADANPAMLVREEGNADPVYLRYDGTSWSEMTLYQPGDAGIGSDLVLDRLGRAHMTFSNITSGQQTYVRLADTSVPHWSTGAYGTGGGASVGLGVDVALDRSGGRHLLYYNASGSRYVAPDGSETSIGLPGSTMLALDVDEDGYAHVAIQDGGALHYLTNRTGSWVDSVADSSSALIGYKPDIAVDQAGAVHISYIDYSNADVRYLKVGGSPVVVNSSVDRNGRTSIAVDASGVVHMTYGLSSGLGYANDQGGTMTERSVYPGPSGTPAARNTALAIGPDGRVHVAVHTWQQNDVYYAVYDGVSWTGEWLEQTPEVGKPVGIAVDSSGRPIVIYKDKGDFSVRLVVRQDDGAWSYSTLLSDCDGDDAHGIDIDIDRDDMLLAACHISTGGVRSIAGRFFGSMWGVSSTRPAPF